MFQSYFINPNKGIYYTERGYHDDVDYIYVVDFDAPDIDNQFNRFIRMIKKDGAEENMQQVKQQFKQLRELLG